MENKDADIEKKPSLFLSSIFCEMNNSLYRIKSIVRSMSDGWEKEKLKSQISEINRLLTETKSTNSV